MSVHVRVSRAAQCPGRCVVCEVRAVPIVAKCGNHLPNAAPALAKCGTMAADVKGVSAHGANRGIDGGRDANPKATMHRTKGAAVPKPPSYQRLTLLPSRGRLWRASRLLLSIAQRVV